MNAKGTRRPHATTPYPRERRSRGGDQGDTIGPGESLADGCWRFVRGVLLLLIVVAFCLFLAVISGGDQ